MASADAIEASGLTPAEIESELLHSNDNKGPFVIIMTTIFSASAVVAVVLRLITRKYIVKIPWRIDDYAIIVALAFGLGLYTESLLSVHYGTGKHVVTVGVEGTVQVIRVTFAIESTYAVVHLATKVSILLLYKSVITLNKPRFKLAWYLILLYVIAFTIASLLGTWLQCSPPKYAWDRFYGMKGTCVNLRAEAISTAALNTAADVALLILPIPTLWNLQMSYKQKLGLCGVFLLGGFACIASVIRIQYLARAEGGEDFTYLEVDSLVWSVIEPCVGIVCACLTTIRPLYRTVFSGGWLSGGASTSRKHRPWTRFSIPGQKTESNRRTKSARQWPSHKVGVPSTDNDSTAAFNDHSLEMAPV